MPEQEVDDDEDEDNKMEEVNKGAKGKGAKGKASKYYFEFSGKKNPSLMSILLSLLD